MMKKYLFLGLFLFTLHALSIAQSHPIISYFNGKVFNDEVLLSWNIIGGNSCNGIIILHSDDNINYTEIGSIPGICGEIIGSEAYSFSDESPSTNQINYYKLQLGIQGFTTPLEVAFYKTGEKGFVLFPNPAESKINLYVNSNYQNVSFEVFDASGKKINEGNLNSGILSPLDISTWDAGNYIIRLLSESTIIGSDRIIKM